MLTFIIALAVAYTFGSISSALIVAKILQLPDPRIEGSKNPGATNMLRIGGKKAAGLTLAGDTLKGLLPLSFAYLIGLSGGSLGWVGVAAVLGHLFPLFANFKGGKGVATTFGVLYGLNFMLGFMSTIIWACVATIFRYSSLAALCTVVLAPMIALLFINSSYFLPLTVLAGLVIWKHYANITRLMNNQEPKIGAKKEANKQ